MVMHACKHITRLSPFSVSSTLMKIKFPMKEKKKLWITPSSSYHVPIFILYSFQVREMEKKKEGKPGEARAAMRRPLREYEYVPYYT